MTVQDGKPKESPAALTDISVLIKLYIQIKQLDMRKKNHSELQNLISVAQEAAFLISDMTRFDRC